MNLPEESRHLCRLIGKGNSDVRYLNFREHRLVRVEAGIFAQIARERSGKQQCRVEQHNAQRDLGRNDPAAEAMRRAAGGGLLQIQSRRSARSTPGRPQTGKERSTKADRGRKQEDNGAGPQLKHPGHAWIRDHAHEETRHLPTEESSAGQAAGTQQERLREHLRKEPPSRGSEGGAHGELMQPRTDARDHDQRDIHAAQQHHQAAESFERHERFGVFPAQPGASRAARFDTEPEVAEESRGEEVVRGIGCLGDLFVDSGEVRLCLSHALAGPQPPHHREPECPGLIQHGMLRVQDALEVQRKQNVDGAFRRDAVEAAREHADNGDAGVVEPDGLANNSRIGMKRGSPVVVAQESHRLPAIAFLSDVRLEGAAKGRAQLQNRKDGSSRERDGNLLRMAIAREGRFAGLPCEQPGGHVLLFLQRLVLRIRKPDFALAFAEGIADQFAGIRDGEAPEQDRPSEQKDGGVGADAEGQGDDCHHGVAWRLAELAEREAKILCEGEHRASSRWM